MSGERQIFNDVSNEVGFQHPLVIGSFKRHANSRRPFSARQWLALASNPTKSSIPDVSAIAGGTPGTRQKAGNSWNSMRQQVSVTVSKCQQTHHPCHCYLTGKMQPNKILCNPSVSNAFSAAATNLSPVAASTEHIGALLDPFSNGVECHFERKRMRQRQ
eukprot:s2786_g3.t1